MTKLFTPSKLLWSYNRMSEDGKRKGGREGMDEVQGGKHLKNTDTQRNRWHDNMKRNRKLT